ncbi:hypothetical protein GALMADRAFT_879541 [Galerina marginata CBS 339.88]|uniref:Uncharacterized protein n=1 Tax=Galerina marginata (strain CBS 339.88) TaxID=685588 RepID=A0A067SI00_GALM3|nr:hypothetical protein GALMADRAFT_879541 [Galerina marginata CBS 339.88]
METGLLLMMSGCSVEASEPRGPTAPRPSRDSSLTISNFDELLAPIRGQRLFLGRHWKCTWHERYKDPHPRCSVALALSLYGSMTKSLQILCSSAQTKVLNSEGSRVCSQSKWLLQVR